jgi:hypothetical protein
MGRSQPGDDLMPGGSEIRRNLSRIGGRSWQCTYHKAKIGRAVRHMGSGKMPQPPLYAIACHRVADSTADYEADAWPVSYLHSMDHEGGTACSYAAPGRLPKFLRAAHS